MLSTTEIRSNVEHGCNVRLPVSGTPELRQYGGHHEVTLQVSAALAGARRGAPDLVLGNVLGSNVFNSLGVAGIAAILGPGVVEGVPLILIGIMLLAAGFAGAFAYTSQQISRTEGVILLGTFTAYVVLSL